MAVVGELRHTQVLCPVVVQGVHVGSEDLLDGAVGAFRLSVRLGVECG
jgi:hypothetical protein